MFLATRVVLHLKKLSLYYIMRKDPAGHNVVNKSRDDRNTWSELLVLSVQREALTRPSTRRRRSGCVVTVLGCCTDSVEARACGVKGEDTINCPIPDK